MPSYDAIECFQFLFLNFLSSFSTEIIPVAWASHTRWYDIRWCCSLAIRAATNSLHRMLTFQLSCVLASSITEYHWRPVDENDDSPVRPPCITCITTSSMVCIIFKRLVTYIEERSLENFRCIWVEISPIGLPENWVVELGLIVIWKQASNVHYVCYMGIREEVAWGVRPVLQQDMVV